MVAILFEDNHVLVGFKPSGIPTQQTEGHSVSFEELLKECIKHRDQKAGNVFLHAVHRIDRVTEGLVVFAKSQKALSRMQESLRQNKWNKHYVAFIEKNISNTTSFSNHTLNQTINHSLNHVMIRDSQKLRPAKAHEDGMLCTLSYKVLDTHNQYTVIDIDLQTGRYHQIRAQFSHIGHPVINDAKYGAKIYTNLSEIALLQYSVSFPHPTKQELVSCKAEEQLLLFKEKWPLYLKKNK